MCRALQKKFSNIIHGASLKSRSTAGPWKRAKRVWETMLCMPWPSSWNRRRISSWGSKLGFVGVGGVRFKTSADAGYLRIPSCRS